MSDQIKYENEKILLKELRRLETLHSGLDYEISNFEGNLHETLDMKRLKKEKLLIKDKIREIRNKLTPDIIA